MSFIVIERLFHARRGDWALPVALSALLLAIYFAVPGAAPDWRYDRAAILDGEAWRLVTGHLLHADVHHLGCQLPHRVDADLLQGAAAAGCGDGCAAGEQPVPEPLVGGPGPDGVQLLLGQGTERVRACRDLVAPLRDAWHEAAASVTTAPAPAPAPAVAAAWTDPLRPAGVLGVG